MKKHKKPIRAWMKKKVAEWLDIPILLRQQEKILLENKRLKEQLKSVVDRSFIGLDLGFKEASQIVMLHYSPLTNCWKVVADSKYNKGTYQQVIRTLRDIVERHNCQYLALDEAGLPNMADIKARIPIPSIMLPPVGADKELM